MKIIKDALDEHPDIKLMKTPNDHLRAIFKNPKLLVELDLADYARYLEQKV